MCVRRLSQIGKAGEAWDGIRLERELASEVRAGGLKHWRSSEDTQLSYSVSVVRSGSGVEVDGRSNRVELASCQRQESCKVIHTQLNLG